MINTNQLCMACMKNKGDAEVCPYCKTPATFGQPAPALPVKTWLMDRYLLGKAISRDGEGISYLGWDNILQAVVTVREFFPDGLCVRGGNGIQVSPVSSADYSACLTEFLDLHRALGRMRDLAALFPVYDIFETNGTAYVVAEYTESISLSEFLNRNHGALTFEQTRTLMLPSLSTLSALHSAGIVHGGISPDTLFVGKDGKLRFGGFASSSLRFAKGSLKVQLFSGYAAIEQYGFENAQAGPHTDVYAFAATMFRVLSGANPMSAKDRVNNDVFTIPATVAEKMPSHGVTALLNAMQLMPGNRTKSVDRFRSEFAATPAIQQEQKAAAGLDDDDVEVVSADGKKKPVLYAILAMLATLLVFIVLFLGIELIWHPFGWFQADVTSTPSVIVISQPSTPSIDTSSQLTRKIPNFVGQSYDAVAQNYSSYQFNVEYRAYTSSYEKGFIISQNPAPDTEIPLESAEAQIITVTVSLGSNQITVPTVQGLTYAEALDKLWQAGFRRESISANVATPAYDDVVVNISPAPGNMCNMDNAEIILYVEKNPTGNTTSNYEDNREVSSIVEPPAQ